MRKQYHFRLSDQGLLAWDIHRLIELSRNFPHRTIRLDEIRELDEEYWLDDNEERPTCRWLAEHMRLVEATSLEHPIILSSEGRVMDGMHRVVKALVRGLGTIEAIRFTTDPEPDYVGCDPGDLPY